MSNDIDDNLNVSLHNLFFIVMPIIIFHCHAIKNQTFIKWPISVRKKSTLNRRNYYVFSSFSLLYSANSFKNCAFGFITFGRSPRQFGQNHLPFGFDINDTHEK